jgi:K+-sensing histidine kinase KdpD
MSQQVVDDFLTIIRRQQLGKLKIYLGPCPGVGKTYQMLIEGNRLRRQGIDVVIGYVEPHERPETIAQIADLEIIPPLVAHHHGITLHEMNVDAVLERKPTVALVDELAHTNAPQSRNRKRYEDVEHLLRAGINVITTRLAAQLNAQWYAVYVRTPDESVVKIDAEVQRRVLHTLEAAQKMGGLVILLKHEQVAQALVSFIKDYGITHVILGRPGKRQLRPFDRPLHDDLIRELPGVYLTIV